MIQANELRTLSFRPFRRVDNKLVVTSYMGWRKIYTANYDGAVVKLLPFPKIEKGEVVYSMGKPDGQYGFWHPTKFEPLFWPINVKIRYKHYSESSTILDTLPIQDDEVYSMFDCDGCPCFSHKTVVYVSENYPEKIHLFEPLTADIVYEYFELMRDQLDKVKWLTSHK
jgi:hypothetical protein